MRMASRRLEDSWFVPETLPSIFRRGEVTSLRGICRYEAPWSRFWWWIFDQVWEKACKVLGSFAWNLAMPLNVVHHRIWDLEHEQNLSLKHAQILLVGCTQQSWLPGSLVSKHMRTPQYLSGLTHPPPTHHQTDRALAICVKLRTQTWQKGQLGMN